VILSLAEIVSRLSQFCALQPGDIVACGTFGGTGWPTGRFLRPGDVVRIEIDGLGELSNPVAAYSARALARRCATRLRLDSLTPCAPDVFARSLTGDSN
jgi:hypothetical protein